MGRINDKDWTPASFHSLKYRITTLSDYQMEARVTAQWRNKQLSDPITYCAMGIAGETGEYVDKIKKTWRGDTKNDLNDPAFTEELLKELGDILWYVTNSAVELGYSLEDVANMNIVKLRDRQNRNQVMGSGDNR